MLSFKSKENGFTLVEVLVVIVILGILTAIAIPIYLHQRQKANEATLITDLQGAAITYQTWQTTPQVSNATFAEATADLTGQPRTQLNVTDPLNAAYGNSPVREWNDVGYLPEMVVSEGNRIEIVVITPETTGDLWNRPHDEREFCLVGTHPNSNYDYVSGTSDATQYEQLLFFDPNQGGVVRLEQLVEAHEAGQQMGCYGYVERYLDAVEVAQGSD